MPVHSENKGQLNHMYEEQLVQADIYREMTNCRDSQALIEIITREDFDVYRNIFHNGWCSHSYQFVVGKRIGLFD